jgi:osmoprotectant transport system permease protein
MQVNAGPNTQGSSTDSVARLGSVLGTASLFVGWLTLRPNRLAGGEALNIQKSLGAFWVPIAVLWLLSLALSLRGKKKPGAAAEGVCANLIVTLVFISCGPSAARLLSGSASIARVSISSGLWLTIISAYIVIFAAKQRLGRSPTGVIISWASLPVIIILLATGWLNRLSLVQEFTANSSRFYQELGQHLFLVGFSVAAGSLLGIALGLWAARSRRAERPIVWAANITQTIPSLALFGLLIAPLSALSFAVPALRNLGIRGVGNTPALIALVLYSLLPVIRNTLAGLRQVEPSVIDAGRGVGMTRGQIFRRIEGPLAAPIILEGVRTASVQAVGLTAVAALIGAGGLGWFIFQGIGEAATDLILVGAIPIVLLAILVDSLMLVAVRLATPKGLSGETS